MNILVVPALTVLFIALSTPSNRFRVSFATARLPGFLRWIRLTINSPFDPPRGLRHCAIAGPLPHPEGSENSSSVTLSPPSPSDRRAASPPPSHGQQFPLPQDID